MMTLSTALLFAPLVIAGTKTYEENWTTGDLDEHLWNGTVLTYEAELPGVTEAELTMKFGLWNSPDVTMIVSMNGSYLGEVVANTGYGSPGPAYETWDVASYLEEGLNIIEVEGSSSGGEAVMGRIDIDYNPIYDVDGDGWTTTDGDCDDDDASRYPGAEELCNGLDDDCDDIVPEMELDLDDDGFSECEGDCDDDDPDAWPGAEELCNGLDDDCDDIVPNDERDADGDGYLACEEDCDDNADAYPGAPDIPDDGIDQDCNGYDDITCYVDDDDDGFGVAPGIVLDDAVACDEYFMAPAAGDCDPQESTTYPGADEICDDGIDQDCDGEDTLCDTGSDGNENEGDADSTGCNCAVTGGGGASIVAFLPLALAVLRRRSRS